MHGMITMLYGFNVENTFMYTIMNAQEVNCIFVAWTIASYFSGGDIKMYNGDDCTSDLDTFNTPLWLELT